MYLFRAVMRSLQKSPISFLDDCLGGYLVTRYLISLGHHHIIGIFKADDTQGQQRHKGYVQALQEAGIAYDPDKVVWFYTEDRKTHPYEQMCHMAKTRCVHFLTVWYPITIRSHLKSSGH